MAQYTSKLNLYKADPATDGDNTFNIDTMMNDNWDKIDDKVNSMDGKLSNIEDHANNYSHPTNHSANMIQINDIGDKFTAENVEEALQEVSSQMADIIKCSDTEPTSFTSDTLWFDISDLPNFNLGGDGAVVANATTSLTPPDTNYWFELL